MRLAKTVIVALAVMATACHNADTYAPSQLSGVVWGTAYNIVYDGSDTRADVDAAVVRALSGVDSVANAFSPSSEISRLNELSRLASPSAHLTYLLELSKNINQLSQGAFDPTVGPLVNLWGFGSKSFGDTPSDSLVALTRALVGIDSVAVSRYAVILRPGMQLDLAAIAKGYGVDMVATALDSLDIRNYMVEVGGEIRVRGRNPEGRDWRIQIDAPVPDSSPMHRRLTVLTLTDVSLATSGNYRNFRTTNDGRLVAHTISPVTGYPVSSSLLSATVLADDCATADALATACMVLDIDKAETLIRRLMRPPYNLSKGALFVTAGPDGTFRLIPLLQE